MPDDAANSQPEAEPFDRLLDEFEVAWRGGSAPAIENFLPDDLSDREQLLRELVKIDLEYRWRRPGPRGSSQDEALPIRPLLESYAERFLQFGPLRRLPVDLIGEEYRVRQRWGDRPDHADYARRFPRQGAALQAALAEIDAELAAESVRDQPPPRATDSRLSSPRIVSLPCPHCRQAFEVAVDRESRHLSCPGCGGTFSVESLATIPGEMAEPPSRRLGRYELGELLGTGAFGSVWQARDTDLARDVAVKLPRKGQLLNFAEEERFLREARSAAQLRHPGIVAVYDVGREQETLYIVSELVRGVSLAEWLGNGRLSFREAAELVAQVADALDYAHRQGVVHRDVKPSNILLEQDKGTAGAEAGMSRRVARRTLVTDFGLALRGVGEITMTLDGQLLGTPAYMSPEQVRDPHAVDGRSDIYSLGVILYELLTAELPFRGMTRMVLVQVLSEEPRPPRQLNDRIPRDLETICLKCLAKEPDRRYPTAGALAEDLRHWLVAEPITARPTGKLERLWLWARRHPGLALIGGLGAAALVAVTGAPAAAVLVAVTVMALLFALHKAKTAAELAQAIEVIKQSQEKTAAVLQCAMQNFSRARDNPEKPLPTEVRAQRRFAQAQKLARTVLFDLPDRMGDPQGWAVGRALLVRTALAYLDGLAREAGDDGVLLRELAVGYSRVGEMQAGPNSGNEADPAAALVSYRKSLKIFTALAAAHPDNAQAQRDLAAVRQKVADLREALGSAGEGDYSEAGNDYQKSVR
jgi:tRNA A-37 threonylcarbamoyl transferase component Bud32